MRDAAFDRSDALFKRVEDFIHRPLPRELGEEALDGIPFGQSGDVGPASCSYSPKARQPAALVRRAIGVYAARLAVGDRYSKRRWINSGP